MLASPPPVVFNTRHIEALQGKREATKCIFLSSSREGGGIVLSYPPSREFAKPNEIPPPSPPSRWMPRQVKNGGVLYVAEGATATFMGTSSFTDNSVMEKTLEPISCGTSCSRTNYVIKKGGAIHNKVCLCVHASLCGFSVCSLSHAGTTMHWSLGSIAGLIDRSIDLRTNSRSAKSDTASCGQVREDSSGR